MEARERIEATLNFEPTDRVPIFDLIRNDTLIERCTGVALTAENEFDLLCQTVSMHLDMTRSVYPPCKPRTIRDKDGFVYLQERWAMWLKKRPFNDVKGLRAYIKKNLLEIADYSPDEKWTRMGRYDLHLPGEEGQSHRERYLAVQCRLGDTLLMPSESPVGLQEAAYRAGLELFVYAYAEDPGLISDWLEAFCEVEVKRIHDVADPTLFPVALVYNDLAHRTGTIFSPAFLRKEFIPRLRRVVEAWRSHNIRVIFHSDGNLWRVLKDLVSTGIDGLNPIETIADMDLGEIRKRFPNLVLMGGIDASQLLAYGTPQQVRTEVKRALEVTGGRGYILGSTTEIHNECHPENVLAMWSAAAGY